MTSGTTRKSPPGLEAFLPSGLPVEDVNGVDLTLIRSCLRRTPAERLADAESAHRSVEELRDAVERHRVPRTPRGAGAS